jgi:integrase
MLTLTKGHVSLDDGTLRLAPGTTKNREGRLVYLTSELTCGVADELARVRDMERKTGTIVSWLFPHLRGPYRGQRITSFQKAWSRACQVGGCPTLLRHDLRNTAARNIVHLGVSERVVMAVMGHKTRSMFDRYHIISTGDLQEVARKLSDNTRTKGTDWGHSELLTGD